MNQIFCLEMAPPNENDDALKLPVLDTSSSSRTRPFTFRSRNVSLPNTSSTSEGLDSSTVVLRYTDPHRTQRPPPSVQMNGPLFSTSSPEPLILFPPPSTGGSSDPVGVSSSQPERYPSFAALEHDNSDDNSVLNPHLLRSEKFGVCNDPYCTTCPSYYNRKADQVPTSRVPAIFYSMFHSALYEDAKARARRFATSVNRHLPGIMNPHSIFIQSWTRLFSLSCLLSIFLDPLFVFLTLVKQNYKCIVIDWPMAKAFIIVRSVTDALFSVNILLQFRLAYVSPESMVVGVTWLVDHPVKIARHYFQGNFFLDLFIVMPLPQILISWITPAWLGGSWENNAYSLLQAAVLLQYTLKLYRLLPLLAGKTPIGFILESSSKFAINFLTFMLAGHVVGSCWYLFGLQRVNQCLRDACGNTDRACRELIDCGRGSSDVVLAALKYNTSASACFQENGFPYGIYLKAVNLTNQSSLITIHKIHLLSFLGFSANLIRMFYGFDIKSALVGICGSLTLAYCQLSIVYYSPKQISTLAGNQVPSYFIWEVLFTMGIIGLGLLLFAFLIGNMQNFLQTLGQRNLEMTLRQRDAEQWMSHRRFPEGIRKRVLEVERFHWAARRGVRIFTLMDESILNAIRERLKHITYISSSVVFSAGDVIEKIVFIVRGEMESIGKDGSVISLSEGDVFGEELLSWCLERAASNTDGTRIWIKRKGLLSYRSVRCVTNVDVFSLSVADLDDVTRLFSRFLGSCKVQGAIRYESPYWRLRAAMEIQVAWRYRRRRLKRLYCSV
ncbi:hypothetical protein HID58_002542 [Brassica napus]|uniref:Cyclic nucleotide-binding domain-containing protein n=2 Tax=Brassica napus TaxID=3708 RepID=A0ABQ8EMJ2_BRANA|nr:hypothetical protein HID58_002512 [Brassica napus]KAH0942905.1 hypothetical protein HID58_002542 [Brassica napus]